MQGVRPIPEESLEGHGIEAVEDPFKSVMRGNAIGQAKELPQPIVSAACKGYGLLPIITIADGRTKSDGDDVDEEMLSVAFDAWVFELAEILVDCQIRMSHDIPP